MKISSVMSGFSLLALLAACGDGTGTGASGGSGGAGGDATSSGAGGVGGSGGEPSGGSGGSGAAGGSGGGGGGIGCIEPADAPFTLATDELCIVATYDAAGLALAPYGASPTWGRHGGPLTLAASNEDLTVSRWSLAGGALTAATTDVTVVGVPEPVYWGPQLVDFIDLNGDLSIASWTGASFDTQGALVALEGEQNLQELATGTFGLAVVGSRVIYTGLSAAGGPTNNTAGLYVADFDSIANGFNGSQLVDGFGLGSGPVALDADGRVFALMVDYIEGTQEARSYPASIATTSTAVAGTSVFEIEGFGDAFAAIAPEGAADGMLVYQPNAGDGSLVQPIVQHYDVNGAPVGAPTALLTLTDVETNLTFMTDDEGRLWVGVDGGASSTFYVLARP